MEPLRFLQLPAPATTHLSAAAGAAHKADGDLFLCPTVRLLADTPLPVGFHDMGADVASGVAAAAAAGAGGGSGDGGLVYEYDGGGHRLVLPDKGHLGELAWLRVDLFCGRFEFSWALRVRTLKGCRAWPPEPLG